MVSLWRPSQSACMLFCFCILFSTPDWEDGALAQQPSAPRVQFDAPYAIAVQEVPFLAAGLNTGERVVECRLDVSSIITGGSERDVTQFVFQLQSLQRSMQVHDYQPRSARDSSITGRITVNEGREESNSAGLDLTGRYHDFTSATLHLGQAEKENGNRKFDRLPALETVVASGTIFRGTGVYFKLHTTDRQLLEGATTLSVQWRVPSSWRADYIHLRCLAEGRVRGQGAQRVGQRDFLIPIYFATDAEAQRAALRFAHSEANLQMEARQSLAEITSKPQMPWSRVFVGDNEQSIPHDWLERLLYLPANAQIPQRLPAQARQAAHEFLSSRAALATLNGWQAPVSAQAANTALPH